jgi:hypothetical protein
MLALLKLWVTALSAVAHVLLLPVAFTQVAPLALTSSNSPSIKIRLLAKVATGSNRVWATADDAVTLISGTNKTLTARVIDTAGNFTALPLSDNSYTLDTSAPSVLAGTHTVVISDDTTCGYHPICTISTNL